MSHPFPTRLRLTNRFIDEVSALPPDLRARRYWDTAVPEMCVQFSKAGTPSFSLRYTKLDGTDGDFAIGQANRITIDSARASAKSALNNLVAHGIDPVEARRSARAEARTPTITTFSQLAMAYSENKAEERARAKKKPLQEIYFLEHYVTPALGNMKLEKITTQLVMDLITRIKAEVALRDWRKGADGKTTANACHRVTKRVFRWAMNAEIVTKNPADFPCMFPIKRGKRRGRLDENRFAAFWKEISATFGGRYRKDAPIAMMLYMITLQRPVDVARAKREHIDLDNRMWVIPEDYTKTGYEYHIPLTDASVALFKIAMDLTESPYVFPSNRRNGPHLHEHSLTRGWIRVRKRLIEKGLLDDVDVELYDCRRFGRTQIRKKLGYSNEVAEAVINHIGEQHSMSQLYDVDELLPDMINAHRDWSAEIEAMTDNGVAKVVKLLEEM